MEFKEGTRLPILFWPPQIVTCSSASDTAITTSSSDGVVQNTLISAGADPETRGGGVTE